MISAIAAVGNKWQLGLNGGLPWPHHAEDMAWFREITEGKVLIAGYNTYRAIKHLTGTLGRIVVLAPLEQAVDTQLFPAFQRPTIIVGGATTYLKFAPWIDQLYLSCIDYNGLADTYFPVEAIGAKLMQNAIWRPS